MNMDLFSQAIHAAQASLTLHQVVGFISAVRMAQMAANRRPRIVLLLESSITHYPDTMSARILGGMERRPAWVPTVA